MRESAYQLQHLEIDLRDALLSKPIIARELIPKLELNPGYLDWFNRPCMNDAIFSELEQTTHMNDYGEYDNLDFIGRSAWSKQKGIGKSSVFMSIKLYYDMYITGNGFLIDEYFFTVPEKLKYHREKAGDLYLRFFVLDEQVDMVGQSSMANVKRMLRIDDTTRIRGFCNGYVSPRGAEWFSHDYYIDIVLKDEKHKTIICCVRTREGTPMGWLGLPRPPKWAWKKYQVKKLEFTKRVETGQIVEWEFAWLYDKVEKAFDMEYLFQQELEYHNAFKLWSESDRKGLKPFKPKIVLSPSRIRNWIVAVMPELTNQEINTSSEVLYAMLDKKVRGGDSDNAKVK